MSLISPMIGKSTGKRARKRPFYKGRYEPSLGPNTKQWWAYDYETHEWCDPPIEVLDDVKQRETINEQEAYFQTVLDTNPAWLYDDGYRFKEDTEI